MFSNASSFMKKKLLKSTSFFGVPLWLLLVASVAAFIVLILVILRICFNYCHRQWKSHESHFCLPNAIAYKHHRNAFSSSSLDTRPLPAKLPEVEMNLEKLSGNQSVLLKQFSTQVSGITEDGYLTELESTGRFSPAVKNVRMGNCFSPKEIEEATNGLAKENVIGSGGFGNFYLGLLPDNMRVTVKKLVNVSCQAEGIGLVKHKKLVKLIGYCTEGACRMSISEYIANANLHHWLHEFPGQIRPLTWNKRVNYYPRSGKRVRISETYINYQFPYRKSYA